MSVTKVAAASGVQSAIATASRKTGVDFNYLLGQAQVESGMRTNARAATSSATGLYQFIDQSWLGVVKKHGAEHGIGWAADAIQTNGNGRFTVSDPGTRRAILDLRNNPQVASLMAAEHAADNKASLEGSLGRGTTGTDLYMAHFLGLGGAKQFLSAMQDNPDRSAAGMFPAAARANRSIFYASNGQPRSLSDIYSRFGDKLDRGAAAVGATGLASGGMPASVGGLKFDHAVEVVLGSETDGSDRDWLASTLDQFAQRSPTAGGNPTNPDALDRASMLRPTPATARLAYLMLARLGA